MKALLVVLLLGSIPTFAAEFEWDVDRSVHENVVTMDAELQMLTLAFLVNETGHRCRPVFHAYQGETESGDHYWMIGCTDGTDWSVMLAVEGYQVISCLEWEKLSERSCLASFQE